MHSSRMRTVRCSSHPGGGRLPGGCLAMVGCLARGCLPRGVSATHPPTPVNRMTDACETRMHSSRMRTTHSSSHPGGVSTRPPPQEQTPHPWDQALPEQTPPRTRHPPSRHPPGRRHPPVDRQTPVKT